MNPCWPCNVGMKRWRELYAAVDRALYVHGVGSPQYRRALDIFQRYNDYNDRLTVRLEREVMEREAHELDQGV